MTENKKQEIIKDAKPKYEPPQIIMLGLASKGSGLCESGSAEDSECYSGSSAAISCTIGSSANDMCETGGSYS